MSEAAFHTLQLERDGSVTWLRLNRPERLNALTEESCAELAEALRAVEADAGARVLVLTGCGRGFCAGSDVDGMRDRLEWSAARQLERFERLGREIVLPLHRLRIPTLAAINGPASGGGLSLALACDVCLAVEDATIGFGFTGVGLIPDLGATYFLPRRIGLSRACALVWSNARLTARQAFEIGLVDEVVPAAQFEARVRTLAATIAAAPELAVRLGRMAMRSAVEGSLEEALEAETRAQNLCLRSQDHRERVLAFLRDRSSRGGRKGAESVKEGGPHD